MTLYRYKAISPEGLLIKGHREVATSRELKHSFRNEGLTLISYSKKIPSLTFRKVTLRDLIDLCIHLEQFEKAGLSLKLSLDELAQIVEAPKLKAVLREVMKDVESGFLFSKALSKHPSVFDSVFVGLIAVGEKTGRLPFILGQIGQHLQWMDEVRAQTFKALRYPLIMACVLFLLMIVLMTVLVPELIVFIKNYSKDLPISTRILIACSGFVSSNLGLILSAPGVLVILTIALSKMHPKGYLWKDLLFRHLPLIGPLKRKLELTRFCHIFAVLFESGIDIVTALRLSRNSLTPGQVPLALEKVEQFIQEGLSLSQSFEKIGFFPKIVVNMIKMGEKTSSLNKALLHVKDYFDLMVRRQVETLVGLTQPLMIMCVGLIMAWIIFSVFLPLYDTLLVMEY